MSVMNSKVLKAADYLLFKIIIYVIQGTPHIIDTRQLSLCDKPLRNLAVKENDRLFGS